MIKIKIRELLDNKDKSVYWLSKQTGITQNNLAIMINGETTSIKFDTLDKICDALECDVADVLKKIK